MLESRSILKVGCNSTLNNPIPELNKYIPLYLENQATSLYALFIDIHASYALFS